MTFQNWLLLPVKDWRKTRGTHPCDNFGTKPKRRSTIQRPRLHFVHSVFAGTIGFPLGSGARDCSAFRRGWQSMSIGSGWADCLTHYSFRLSYSVSVWGVLSSKSSEIGQRNLSFDRHWLSSKKRPPYAWETVRCTRLDCLAPYQSAVR